MQQGISIFIGAVTDEKTRTSVVVQAIRAIREVKIVYELTGSLDLLILAQSDSIKEINNLIESVRACNGVKETTTYLVLEATENK